MQAPFTQPVVLPAQDTITVVERTVPESVYVAALERASGQMGTLWSTAAWFVGALGVLFAVGAIIAGVLLWMQSRDFRERHERWRASQDDRLAASLAQWRAVLDHVVAEKNEEIALLVADSNRRIEGVIKELEERAETATEEQKTEIGKEIAKLREAKRPVVEAPRTVDMFQFRYGEEGSSFGLTSRGLDPSANFVVPRVLPLSDPSAPITLRYAADAELRDPAVVNITGWECPHCLKTNYGFAGPGTTCVYCLGRRESPVQAGPRPATPGTAETDEPAKKDRPDSG